MPSDKIIEEKPEEKTKKNDKDKDEGKQFEKAIDETDIAIFKRYEPIFLIGKIFITTLNICIHLRSILRV